jgi:hypothetical protein
MCISVALRQPRSALQGTPPISCGKKFESRNVFGLRTNSLISFYETLGKIRQRVHHQPKINNKKPMADHLIQQKE